MGKEGAVWGRASLAFVGARLSCLARDGGRGVERDKIVGEETSKGREETGGSYPFAKGVKMPESCS